MRPGLRLLRDRLRGLLHLDDPPARIAAALAVGVFISFTPFWGVQTLLSLLVATVFRLNKAATVTGAWLNLPWFAPFVYAGALTLGARLVPEARGLAGVSAALLLGTTILGLGAAALTYAVSVRVIAARRGRRAAGRAEPTGRHAA